MPSVNGALTGGPTYLLSSKDDKILQFYKTSVPFLDVFIVENAHGGGVLARFYRPGEGVLNSFFARGCGMRPLKKLPGGDSQASNRLIH